jgi:signal peptidase II
LLFDRHVADFMNFGINHFRTGIFNIADVCVTSGLIGVLIFSIKKPSSNT